MKEYDPKKKAEEAATADVGEFLRKLDSGEITHVRFAPGGGRISIDNSMVLTARNPQGITGYKPGGIYTLDINRDPLPTSPENIVLESAEVARMRGDLDELTFLRFTAQIADNMRKKGVLPSPITLIKVTKALADTVAKMGPITDDNLGEAAALVQQILINWEPRT